MGQCAQSVLTSLLGLFSCFACLGVAFSQDDLTEYMQSIHTWRQERTERLVSDTGWLTIAGLHWLSPGQNSVGTDPRNDIVLSADSAPAHIGVFTIDQKTATFRAEPGVEIFQKGKKVQTVRLEAGTPSDALVVGRLRLWLHTSGERFAIRLRDPGHPLRKTFSGLGWFPVDAAYRVHARFEPYASPKSVTMLNVLGDLEQFTSPGCVVFELQGKTIRLEPVVSEEDDLFFVFRDATSGKETYEAARFLRAAMPPNELAGQIVLDFNKAYNPPCVFNPFTTCPLPPRQNRLALPIEAGELMYHK